MNSILFNVITELKTTRKELGSLLIVILQYVDDQPLAQLPQLLESTFEKAGLKKKRTVHQAREYADSAMQEPDGHPPLDEDVRKLV